MIYLSEPLRKLDLRWGSVTDPRPSVQVPVRKSAPNFDIIGFG